MKSLSLTSIEFDHIILGNPAGFTEREVRGTLICYLSICFQLDYLFQNPPKNIPNHIHFEDNWYSPKFRALA